MSSNYGFEPTLDGLNNIDANNSTTENIVCDTIQINVSGNAPTIANPLDYSTSIATTEWVTNHAGVGYVTLNTSQTLTAGIKTFQNLPECATTATTNNQLVNLNTLNSAISTAGSSYVTLAGTQTLTSGIKTFSNLPECATTATTNNQLVNLNTLNSAISAVSGSFVTLNTTQTITGDKSFNGSIDFLSLEASLITNTGSIDTPNIGSGLATDPISIVPSQSSGTCNIATFATRTGSINVGTGTSAKTMTIGGTATTTNINSLTTTINTSTTSGNGITHSSTTTAGDDMRLTATGGYLARLGEGSSSAGLTLLGIDAGTSIIKATTSALEIRADAGLTFTGTIGSNNTFSGTNTLTGVTQFNNNLRVASTSTIRLGTALTGTLIGQTFTNEVTAQNINASDKFIFRTSTNTDIISFADSGILVSSATSFLNDTNINQATYPSTGTTQIGYTIQKTFATTVLSDTTGTFSVVGSGQAIGTNKGVYLITCGFELTNSGSDTMTNKAIVLSLTSGSGTPVNAFGAWEYYDEINDSMGAGGTRYIGTLCGVYIKTTTSAQSLFLNGYSNTSGSATISCSGTCSITRIG